MSAADVPGWVKYAGAAAAALFIGSTSYYLPRGQSDAEAALAAEKVRAELAPQLAEANAKLEATRDSLQSCLDTVDHLTGSAP